MKRSVDRILTSHVGSLPRRNDLAVLYRENAPDDKLVPRLRSTIAEVLQRRRPFSVGRASPVSETRRPVLWHA